MTKRSFLIAARDLPLWFWGFGYIDFLSHTAGTSSLPLGFLSIVGTLAAAAWSLWQNHARWRNDGAALLQDFKAGFKEEPFVSFAYAAGGALLAAIFFLAFLASLKPPHLLQEYDAYHYQMGIPQQLLVRRSLAPIAWSVTDLWPMAMQYGMAPLAGAFTTFNKLPQFLFALGAAACLFRLPLQLTGAPPERRLLLPLFAVLGSHGVVLQLGLAMMDLPQLYLLLLCASAILDCRWTTAAFALAVFTASKAFNPFLAAAMLTGGLGCLCFARTRLPIRPVFTRFLPVFSLLSVLLLARTTIHSMQLTGTPLFPFLPCKFMQGSECGKPGLQETVSQLLNTRNSYGDGRGIKALIAHLWRIAIPITGVNNEFDYPLGLPWLLLLVLYFTAILRGGWRRPIAQLTALLWFLWWMNSHQSRWLYPVIAFGFLATIPEQARVRRTLPFLLALSCFFSLLSEFRAHSLSLRSSSAALQAERASEVRWAPDGALQSTELLYVNRPALRHTLDSPLWVLP